MALPDLYPGVDPGVQETIRRICGWHVAPQVTETVTLDGSGDNLQLLPTLYLVDLVSITNEGTAVPEVNDWSRMGAVRMPGCGRWTGKYRGVVAEMVHGFEVCPSDIKTAAARLAVLDRMFKAGGGSVRVGQVQVSAPGGTIEWDGLDPGTRAFLAPYRLTGGRT